jgi:hypothetical protein
MQQNTFTKNLIIWSAAMTVLAGMIHIYIVPQHWDHAPAHGLLFLIVGIVQILWGIAVWRQPSVRLYYVGVLMAGGLIVLYVITRLLPAPFGHGAPEAMDAVGLVCKLCEVLGMFSLVVLIFQGLALKTGRLIAWRAVALIMLLSLMSGFATYGVALAAEPVFPKLSSEEHHQNESEPASEQDHHHDEGAADHDY